MPNLEADPKGIPSAPCQEIFHGTLANIKSAPKTDMGRPDSRLENMNRGVFF
jgi:hypothetical protein